MIVSEDEYLGLVLTSLRSHQDTDTPCQPRKALMSWLGAASQDRLVRYM